MMMEIKRRTYLNIGLIIFYIILTILTVYLIPDYYHNFLVYPSLQLIGIIAGSSVVVGFLVLRIKNWPKITTKNAQIYLNASITIIVGVSAIIGLIFSIIYGSLYSNAIVATYNSNATKIIFQLNPYVHSLVNEGIALFLITCYAVIVIVISFIFPLTKKLDEFQE